MHEDDIDMAIAAMIEGGLIDGEDDVLIQETREQLADLDG